MPESTLKALADHGGIDVHSLAGRLQEERAKSFVQSWNELMAVITAKKTSLQKAAAG